MKPNMKKKFDFSTEMSEVESIKTTPKNEYQEEEKRLLDVNAKELASLNDNVYKLRTEVENLSGSIRECKPIIPKKCISWQLNLEQHFSAIFLVRLRANARKPSGE